MDTAMSGLYGYRLSWTHPDGSVQTVESPCQYETGIEAMIKVTADAIYFGWKPPRWWQIGRWRDTRVPAVVVLEAIELLKRENRWSPPDRGGYEDYL
jgi:hypothetical protein